MVVEVEYVTHALDRKAVLVALSPVLSPLQVVKIPSQPLPATAGPIIAPQVRSNSAVYSLFAVSQHPFTLH